jgi:hypothetical protein
LRFMAMFRLNYYKEKRVKEKKISHNFEEIEGYLTHSFN